MHVDPTGIDIGPLRSERRQRPQVRRWAKRPQGGKFSDGRRQRDGECQGGQAVSETAAGIDQPQSSKRPADQLDEVRPQEHRPAL